MKPEIEKSTVLHLNPWNIEPNRDNPRRLFDEEDLDSLKQSINMRGVLVPLIVYKDNFHKNRFILLDGERRLKCAQALNMDQVPANVIKAPDRAENILLMFNIHNVRKDWELVPTALKLETLINLLKKKNGKEPSNTELSKLTGLSIIRVADCKRVLKYKKYHDLTLHPDPAQRIGGDFFSQLELALEKINSLVDESSGTVSKIIFPPNLSDFLNHANDLASLAAMYKNTFTNMLETLLIEVNKKVPSPKDSQLLFDKIIACMLKLSDFSLIINKVWNPLISDVQTIEITLKERLSDEMFQNYTKRQNFNPNLFLRDIKKINTYYNQFNQSFPNKKYFLAEWK